MGFMKANKNEDALKEGGDGKHITKSGIYPVTIVGAFISEGKGGDIVVDFCVNHQDKVQVLYGNLHVYNKDGGENEVGMKTLNKLLVVSDIENLSDPVDGELPIGPKGAMKDVSILEDLTDVECYIHVQEEYGKWNGSYTDKKVIKSFWGADGASAAEHVKGESIGENMANTEENYAHNVTYSDDVTKDEIDAWIKANRPKGTAGSGSSSTGGNTSTPKASFNKPKAKGGFGKK